MAAEEERRMENGAGGATFLQFSTVFLEQVQLKDNNNNYI